MHVVLPSIKTPRCGGSGTSLGLSPGNLELEITESILIDSFESNAGKSLELRLFGVRVALDDFGSLYSSLNYLRSLPITTLKIDKSFVDMEQRDFESRILVNSVNDIACVMGLEIIAEGLQTETRRMIFAESKCHWMHRCPVSKALSSEELDLYIDSWKRDEA